MDEIAAEIAALRETLDRLDRDVVAACDRYRTVSAAYCARPDVLLPDGDLDQDLREQVGHAGLTAAMVQVGRRFADATGHSL